jgi:hypothetical protein
MPFLAAPWPNQETMMPRFVSRIAVVVAIVLVAATSVRADPVRVVTGLLYRDTGGPAYFLLQTSDGRTFEAEAVGVDWPADCFYQCAAGVTMPLSSVVTDIPDYREFMFFEADGVPAFPDIDFVFSAPSVTLGSDTGSEEDPFLVFRRPFTFSGRLAGYATADLSGQPLFDVALAGSGEARLQLAVDGGLYSFSSLEYSFQSTDPVPEPGTLLLVGGGAAFLMRNRRARARAIPTSTIVPGSGTADASAKP